jgi:hypothetical protein
LATIGPSLEVTYALQFSVRGTPMLRYGYRWIRLD